MQKGYLCVKSTKCKRQRAQDAQWVHIRLIRARHIHLEWSCMCVRCKAGEFDFRARRTFYQRNGLHLFG